MIIKKYLYIIPILFFTFIFGVNNVKAQETYYIKEYYDTRQNQYVNSNISISSSILNSMFTTDLNSFKNSYTSFNYGASKMNYVVNQLNKGTFDNYISQYDSYIMYAVNANNTGGNICFFNKEDAFLREGIKDSLALSLKYGICYQYNKNKYITIENDELYHEYAFKFSNNEVTSLYSSNIGLVYLSDESIIDYFLGNPIPEISITKLEEFKTNDLFGNEYITSVKYSLNFSIFDTSKYKYLYSLDKDINTSSLNPIIINENNLEVLISKNCVIHIKILDNNDNYITSSSFIISGLSNSPPIVEKDVNYENGGITYNNLIKIPIEYLYDSNNLKFNSYNLFFLSKSKEDPTSDFYITLLNEKEGKEIPLIVDFRENIKDISTYENEDIEQNTGSSGGANSSGGGRHDTFQSCEKTSIPYQKTIFNDNTNYYNVLHLQLYNCKYTEKLYLKDFSTTYIYVYYNARIYEDLESIVNDYDTNRDNFENSDKSFIDYIKTSLNYFIVPVREIFKLITYFFNGLPSIIRYMFITIFIISVILIIFKLLL